MPTLEQARDYMCQWDLAHAHGYVIFFEGTACGWSAELLPKTWRPGCLAVELTSGKRFEGVGGSYTAGCERWEVAA